MEMAGIEPACKRSAKVDLQRLVRSSPPGADLKRLSKRSTKVSTNRVPDFKPTAERAQVQSRRYNTGPTPAGKRHGQRRLGEL